ncbi:hypothetical protein SteCoe_2211 [Stentor coeruleus]|uniref:Mannosyltransferase n=1 Tax=Stentor coeruleus TaxID=5963 RepID=A0A1R2CZY7_9CILI|nr:hypothetical protein SteCoe_2211 [Stentor coeruleus]
MKNEWDYIFLSVQAYYIILFPYTLSEESDADQIHNILIHNEKGSVISCIFSYIFYPVFSLFGIKVTILASRIFLVILFFICSKSIKTKIEHLHGEDTAVAFYLITLLQSSVSFNSSRFLINNYAYLIGTLSFLAFLSQKKLLSIICLGAFILWQGLLVLGIYFHSSSYILTGNIYRELPLALVVSGILSKNPLKLLIDPALKGLDFYVYFVVWAFFGFSSYVFLPVTNFLAARGLIKLTTSTYKLPFANYFCFAIGSLSILALAHNCFAYTVQIDFSHIKAVENFHYLYMDTRQQLFPMPDAHILLTDLPPVATLYLDQNNITFSNTLHEDLLHFTHIISKSPYFPGFLIFSYIEYSNINIYKFSSQKIISVYIHQRTDIDLVKPKKLLPKCRSGSHA